MRIFDRSTKKLESSFANVKKDTTLLFDWVKFLYRQLQQQDKIISEQAKALHSLHDWLGKNTLTEFDVKKIVDNHKAVINLHSSHNQLARKLGMLAVMHDNHHAKIQELHAHLAKKNTALKEKIVSKVARNSKAYIKNAIQSYIVKYGEISALQLKEIVVDDQKLCSKSTFYRLLSELEAIRKISVVKDGKQKIYVRKQHFAKP